MQGILRKIASKGDQNIRCKADQDKNKLCKSKKMIKRKIWQIIVLLAELLMVLNWQLKKLHWDLWHTPKHYGG
jgi:hypothetical protein